MTPVIASSIISYRDKRYLAAVAILLPIVCQRLFIGGAEGEYTSYSGVTLAWVGYLVHFGFIISLAVSRLPERVSFWFPAVIFLLGASLLQAVNSIYLFHSPILGVSLTLFRSILWITACCIYASRFFDVEAFTEAFYDVMKMAILFILFCYFFYKFTDIPLGVNISKSLPRAHGTFSEPSTLSCVVPAFIVISLIRHRYLWALTSVLVLFIAASAITTSTTILIFILFFLRKYTILRNGIILLIISLAVLFTTSLGPGAAAFLDAAAHLLDKSLDATIGNGLFRQNTFDRIVEATNGLATFFSSNSSLQVENSGGLARLYGAFVMLNNMEQDGTTWFGYGLSVYGYTAGLLYGTVLDFGLYPYLISSFGIAAGTLLIYIIGFRTLNWYLVNQQMFFIFTGALIGTIYNSGGGIMAYSLCMLALVVPVSPFKNNGKFNIQKAMMLKTRYRNSSA